MRNETAEPSSPSSTYPHSLTHSLTHNPPDNFRVTNHRLLADQTSLKQLKITFSFFLKKAKRCGDMYRTEKLFKVRVSHDKDVFVSPGAFAVFLLD